LGYALGLGFAPESKGLSPHEGRTGLQYQLTAGQSPRRTSGGKAETEVGSPLFG